MKLNKFTALLLGAIVALSTACDGAGSSSTPETTAAPSTTAAATTAAATTAETKAEETKAEETSAPAEEGAIAIDELLMKDVLQPKFQAGVLQVADGEFVREAFADGAEFFGKNKFMIVPGGPAQADSDNLDRIMANKELWENIESITVKFKITQTAGEPLAEDEADSRWIGAYAIMGPADKWAWIDGPTLSGDGKLMQPDGEAFPIDKEIEYTYDIKKVMSAKERAGGIAMIGFQYTDAEGTDKTYKIEWLDVQVKGNVEIINKYTKIAKELVEAGGGVFEPTGKMVEPTPGKGIAG